MKEDFFGRKNKSSRRDPLDFSFRDTAKTLVGGAIVLGIGIPLVTGIANSLGGHN
jgi:hypothetical protein